MTGDEPNAASLDENLMGYWGTYALAEGGRHIRLGAALFMQTAIPHSLFNSVILLGWDAACIDEALGLSAECLEAGGIPVLWRVSPLAENPELRAHLQGLGLQLGDPSPAMLADLDDLPMQTTVGGLEISAAANAGERHEWGRLAIDAFGMDKGLCDPMGRCEATIPESFYESQPRFTGYLDGQPVAVSSLVMTDGVAGIYAVATLPHARKRGIGTAMTLHAMKEGARRGAKVATLQATSMGRPVYEKIGFRTVFHYQNYLHA